MTSRRVASVAGVIAGVGWLAKAALIWANGGQNTGGGLMGVVFLAGLIGVVVALGAAGYALVRTAPLWLRAVVTVAVPLLVMMVWQLLDQAIKAVYTDEGWLRGELSIILAALTAVAAGTWGLARQQQPPSPERPATAAPRRRATR
jgi:hypothetical protein